MDLYLLNVTSLYNERLFEKYYTVSRQYRKNKIDKLKNKEDKVLSLGAEILFLAGIKRYGIDVSDVVVAEYGKPYLKNNDVFFSVSHSGLYATAVFDTVDVGVDIETQRKVNPALLNRLFTQEEATAVFLADDSEKEFLRLWTRKECLFKAVGCGINRHFGTLSVLGNSVIFEDSEYSIQSFSHDDCVISVARRGEIEKIEVREISLSHPDV